MFFLKNVRSVIPNLKMISSENSSTVTCAGIGQERKL